jgi:hypothetical protein
MMPAKKEHQELDGKVVQICTTSDALCAAPIPDLQKLKAQLEAEQTKVVKEIQTIRLEARNFASPTDA